MGDLFSARWWSNAYKIFAGNFVILCMVLIVFFGWDDIPMSNVLAGCAFISAGNFFSIDASILVKNANAHKVVNNDNTE
jgi:hypothetical protein